MVKELLELARMQLDEVKRLLGENRARLAGLKEHNRDELGRQAAELLRGIGIEPVEPRDPQRLR